MKTEKWMPTAAFAALLTITAACDDWGKQDPPAGNQVVPTLENVATYDFEAEEGLDPTWQLIANPGGNAPSIIEDETEMKGGKVLEINGGYASLPNPLNNVVCQEAVSLTFWLYQAAPAEPAEGEEPREQDLTSPIVSFVNETGNGTFHINANGGMVYDAADGEWTENDPAEVKTGYLKPGEWHYVAVMIDKDGYDWWVDGDRKVSKPVVGFDCSKIVRLANNVKTMTVGGPETTSRLLIDDLKVYRNRITAKETARPNIGGSDEPVIDFSKWVLLGNEDSSTGFWSTWAPYVNLTGDGTIHYDFYNFHDGKTNNWCNWALVLTNGPERGAPGYSEYVYLRADAYGWGSAYNGENIKHDFNWDTFMAEMDGAFVSLDIVRVGTDVTVTALVTAADGKTVHNYSIKLENVDSEVLGSFLTCEGSHLYINPETVFVGQTYGPKKLMTGAEDLSTGFWGAHSPNNRFDGPFKNYGFEFTNHTLGGANWNNWVLVCTNGPWVGEGGYAEHFVARSDAFGWGAASDAGNVSYEHSFDWDTYRFDMIDAKVKIIMSYDGSTLTVYNTTVTADGRMMPDYRIIAKEIPAPIGLFFTVDGSCLEFSKVGYYPWSTMGK